MNITPSRENTGNAEKPKGIQLPGELELRDYFAAAALQGMLAYSYVNPSHGNYHENCTSKQAAGAAYDYADAMIKQRTL